jgi:hypothetical protein
MRIGRTATLLAALVVAGALAGPAPAGPSLVVGVSDDYLKSEPAAAAAAIRSLGLGAVRLTLDWSPGQQSIASHDIASLRRAIDAGSGARIFVVMYADSPYDAPRTPEARDAYCSTLRSVVQDFPQINDVIVWNEPNKSTFWRPQFNSDGTSAAPADYAALLAQCHAVLHAFRPGINVIHAGLSSTGNDRPDAASNISHSPGNFIRREGEALRAGLAGRRPAAAGGQLYDTFALHPYGESSTERPWKQHDASSTIALGDWDKLMQALWDAFHGTSQPLPSQGAGIMYLELGFQTSIVPLERVHYRGAENVETVPDLAYETLADSGEGPGPDQATQLADAIELAYCQPYVEGIFNFLLKDEPDLGGWQSGLIWADWTPKGSSGAVQRVIAEVRSGSVDCAHLKGGPVQAFQPKEGVDVRQVAWPRSRSFNWKNALWRFRVQTGEDASYAATLFRAGAARAARGARGAGAGTPVFAASGALRRLYLSWVVFPHRRLAPGRYFYQVVLTSAESSSRATRLTSPTFVVKPKR